jgi:hypothetical protein
VHTRKAGGDGCTVTNGYMGDGWERMVTWPTDIMADTIGYITPDGPPMCKNARPVHPTDDSSCHSQR